MTGSKATGARPIYPFDWLVIGYSLTMVVAISLFGRPLESYVGSILFYSAMAVIAAMIVRYVDEMRGRLAAFIRIMYPAVMFTFFYTQTGGLMFLLHGEFFDWQLVTFEKMLFGVHPTLYIDSHLLSVWTTEVLSFCYFSYYLMLPGFLFPVFIKRDYDILKRFLTATCLTFFLSYLLFSLYPVEGPRWHFAADYMNQVEGPMFRQMVNFVIHNGAVHGGAMPSSHTGVALVIMLFCFRHYRAVGWILLPIVIGLAAGTVWGRFHYVSDVIVGAAIAVFSDLLVLKYYDRWVGTDRQTESDRKVVQQHVS